MDDRYHLIPSYLQTKSCLVVNNHSEERLKITEILKELGFSKSNIVKVDSFQDASEQIINEKVHFVIADYKIGSACGLDLLKVHIDSIPNRLDSGFCLLMSEEDDELQELRTRKGDLGIDVLITKPYEQEIFIKEFKKGVVCKASPTEYDYEIEKGKRLLLDGSLSEALEVFRTAKTMDEKPASAFYYEGVILHKEDDERAAKKNFEECIKYSPKHFECLNILLDIYLRDKEYVKAYEIGSMLYQNHPIKADQVPVLARLIIGTNHCEEIKKFTEFVIREFRSDSPAIKPLCAGLAVAGKNMVDQKKTEDGVELLIKGASLANGDIAILSNILNTLSILEKFEEIKAILDNQSDKTLKGRDFAVLNLEMKSKFESPSDIVQMGNEVLKRKITHFKVFDIMIKAYQKLEMKNDIVEDLVRDAIKYHPSMESRFLSYIK